MEVTIDNYSKAILKIAKEMNLSADLVEDVVRSQFKLMKLTINERKNHFKLKYIGKFFLKGTIPASEEQLKYLENRFGKDHIIYKKKLETTKRDNGGLVQPESQD